MTVNFIKIALLGALVTIAMVGVMRLIVKVVSNFIR